MSFDFPASPVIDTVFTDTVSGKSYTYDGEKWQAQGGSSSSSGATGVEEAPMDSTPYMRRDGAWVPYDFDRSQLVNVVAGLPLRRNWDVGLRLQYQSGKPETITAGYNEARTAGYVRFDMRVDKRAVWRSWLLDFYVDVANVALLPEEVTAGTVIRYVLPTVGLRGRF